MPSAPKAQDAKVLVLGDGHDTAKYLELCENLANALGSAAVVLFRPHPLERARVNEKHPGGFVGQVHIDVNSDIYKSLKEANILISEVSTGLFEAIGLVSKVFIWNTHKSRFAFPEHPFQCFTDVNELTRMIIDENVGQVSAQQIQSIWAPNWRQHYLNYIKQVVPQ